MIDWIMPVVAGALIGWVTNAIAIRMLFRPRREWRVLGLRVPFTPGIIPRNRGQLAESLSRAVAHKLLDAQGVRDHLRSPEFRDRLRYLSGKALKTVLAIRLADWLEVLKQWAQTADSWIARTAAKPESSLQALLGGQERSRQTIERLILDMTALLERWRKAQTLNSAPLADVEPSLAADPTRAAESATKALPQGGMAGFAAEALAKLYPLLIQACARWLRDPGLEPVLVKSGRQLADRVIQELSAMQRIMVSVGGYDRRLSERMPVLVQETIDRLEAAALEPEVRKQVLRAVFSPEKDALQGIAAELLAWLNGPGEDEGSRARDLAIRLVEELGNRPLAELFPWLGREPLSRLVAGLAGRAGRRSLGSLLHIGFDLRKRLQEFLFGALSTILEEGSATVLKTVDVEALVYAKVQAMDDVQLENLILSVLARHLKWINLFGALLGGLVGLLQAVLGAQHYFIGR